MDNFETPGDTTMYTVYGLHGNTRDYSDYNWVFFFFCFYLRKEQQQGFGKPVFI